jgi:hypothetical protein
LFVLLGSFDEIALSLIEQLGPHAHGRQPEVEEVKE